MISIAEVVDEIEWSPRGDYVVSKLALARRRIVRAWLDRYLNSVVGGGRLDLDSYLGPDTKTRCLDSPVLWSVLRSRVRPPQISVGPAAFLALAQEYDRGRWSGGKQVLDYQEILTAKPEVFMSPFLDRGEVLGVNLPPEAIYMAPRVGGGGVIDLFSPFSKGTLPEISGRDDVMSDKEVIRAVTLLQQGFAYVSAVSPAAMAVVDVMTSVALLRKDSSRPGTGSASTPRSHGRPVFFNIHEPEVCDQNVADLVVHEAIHGIFDILEIETPVATTPEARENSLRIASSPWTGRALAPDTFVQACFVWYGLLNFWIQAASADASEVTVRQAAYAAGGFMKRGLVDYLGEGRHYIRPPVLEVLSEMQRRALRAI